MLGLAMNDRENVGSDAALVGNLSPLSGKGPSSSQQGRKGYWE